MEKIKYEFTDEELKIVNAIFNVFRIDNGNIKEVIIDDRIGGYKVFFEKSVDPVTVYDFELEFFKKENIILDDYLNLIKHPLFEMAYNYGSDEIPRIMELLNKKSNEIKVYLMLS